MDKDIGKIPLRELPRTVRDTSVAGGVAEDKSIKLREGTPDPTTAGRSVKEIVAALKAKGFDLSKLKFTQTVEMETDQEDHREDAIEGTATETQD